MLSTATERRQDRPCPLKLMVAGCVPGKGSLYQPHWYCVTLATAEGFTDGHMSASQKPLKRETHIQQLLSLSRAAGARGWETQELWKNQLPPGPESPACREESRLGADEAEADSVGPERGC